MKSVGEAMAVGRSFAESLQKALRSLETGLNGLSPIPAPEAEGEDLINTLKGWISGQTPDRILRIAQAMRMGMSVEVPEPVRSNGFKSDCRYHQCRSLSVEQALR